VLPPAWVEWFRTGTDLEVTWLTTLVARAKKFRAKIPGAARSRGPRAR
jgi:hypothetical protein